LLELGHGVDPVNPKEHKTCCAKIDYEGTTWWIDSDALSDDVVNKAEAGQSQVELQK
jgi:hypothetical protein